MERTELLQTLKFPNDTKILFWVFDGVGGLPHPDTGKTELEAAHIPHLDAFAQRAACAGLEPFGAGITPGSGPGHMSLFGYDVGEIELPRGVLEVLGAEEILHGGERVSDFQLTPGDLCMRGNYATLETVDGERVVADRRANRIATEDSHRVSVEFSRQVTEIDGRKVFVLPGKQHRFAVVIRGEGLSGPLTDADPQRSGLPPKEVEALAPEAEVAATIVNKLVGLVTEVLVAEPQANTVLLRGIGTPPDVPTLEELYGIRCAAIATYPMYRGIASLVGMDVVEVGSMSHADEVKRLEETFDDYDFFYLHIKETDSYGHTGEFDKKVGVLEECDPLFERALKLDWDVVVVTGDHCTPCVLGEHSWHPIPTALWSKHCLSGNATAYSERQCNQGSYGVRASREILPLALAEAGRIKKFGA